MQGDFFLTQWAFLGMRWLYETLTNESIFLTIILSTVLIRALSVFGDIKSRQSSLRMAAVQPQLDKLRKKYENDPQRLNVETQKVMKANNVSMFGGCLPMLITMPIFFIFIAAFRQWGNEMMVKLILALEENEQTGLEMFAKFKFLWVNNMWQPDSGLKPVIQAAAEFFSKTNETLPKLLYFKDDPAAFQKFVDWGYFVLNDAGQYVLATSSNVSAEVFTALSAHYTELVQPCMDLYAGYNNGWFLFPLLAGGSMFLSSWIMQRNQPKNEAANGSMKIMTYAFPLMSVFFCLSYNASFALYWTFSSLLSVVTTLIINRVFAKQTAAAEAAKNEGAKQ